MQQGNSTKKVVIPRHGTEELVSQIREQERVISQAGTIRYEHDGSRCKTEVTWNSGRLQDLSDIESFGTIMIELWLTTIGCAQMTGVQRWNQSASRTALGMV